jgi:hypothetical protein
LTDSHPVRVQIPFHLQTLAHCDKEVGLQVQGKVSVLSIVHALEKCYPMLAGTIIDHHSGKRQPKVRFYADGKDVSLQALDGELPEAIRLGAQPLMIIGAISGG